MTRRMAVLLLLATGCATTSTTSPATAAAATTYRVKLDPASEVPQPNLGSATPSGSATFTISGTSISYELSAQGLSTPPVMAHIHTGAPGVAGPVIVPLKVGPGAEPGSATGQGSIDASGITGKNADGSPMSFQDLLKAIQSGQTYVNVHTSQNKPGEIRGQIGS